MVFYSAFNSISVISQPQHTLFMSSWVSPVLGWGSEVSCPRTLPRKNQRIQCGSNPGHVDYQSNTLPMSHTGPPLWEKKKLLIMSNFSFSHSVFYPFGELPPTLSNSTLSSANAFSLEESEICRLGKGYRVHREEN